eukprot:CAMPEP_0178413992 /NCGR_PEP_ID=MMETSP0689_2-20121128/22809_1 /TAXON_ID=160604 /ORGANISM="Amphidinium massartii, Strain CS-259" /LENGTH=323 /DNA_ID=CAMNT_0020035273 /DNA_START=164 /DNA_END=1131 /DNA_ORIENTATION=-
MESGTLFTLEFIANSITTRQPTILPRSQLQGSRHQLQPLLVLRLLDLESVQVDGPAGEMHRLDKEENQVNFRGCGKALSFHLPSSSTEAKPVLLWIMALGKVPGAKQEKVLCASACLDVTEEVQGESKPSGRGFQRCTLRMTPAPDIQGTWSLDCYVRLYPGSPQSVQGHELLLQASSVKAVSLQPQGQAAMRTQSTQTDRPESREEATSSSRSTAQTQLMWPRPLPRQQGRIRDADTFFPEELAVRKSGSSLAGASRAYQEQERSLGEQARGGEHIADRAKENATAPDVAPALPLVAELLRELYQIRSITSSTSSKGTAVDA